LFLGQKTDILRAFQIRQVIDNTYQRENLCASRKAREGDKRVKTELLDAAESKSLKKNIPHFEIGDVVDVHCRIKEGDKERIQVFSGTVISRKGRGINEIFTVRRIVDNEGVERIFPIHSPNIVDIRPIRSGKARRAKLYFLRRRTGKAVRLAQRHSEHTVSK
jgi:large subunit ribosomal protein L19